MYTVNTFKLITKEMQQLFATYYNNKNILTKSVTFIIINTYIKRRSVL